MWTLHTEINKIIFAIKVYGSVNAYIQYKLIILIHEIIKELSIPMGGYSAFFPMVCDVQQGYFLGPYSSFVLTKVTPKYCNWITPKYENITYEYFTNF